MEIAQSVGCRQRTRDRREIQAKFCRMRSCAHVHYEAIKGISSQQSGNHPSGCVQTERLRIPQPERAQWLPAHAPLKPRRNGDTQEQVASRAQMKNDSQRDPDRHCRGDLHRAAKPACLGHSCGRGHDCAPADSGEVSYFAAIAATSEWKIFAPSVMPSSGAEARSGCGIMPRTLRPSLQIPAMFSSEPLGLAAEVTSPLGVV